MTELAVKENVDVIIHTPLLDSLNAKIMKDIGKELPAVQLEIDQAIERGVETDDNAAFMNDAIDQSNGVLKALHELRMVYTRPLNDVVKSLIDEENSLGGRLTESRDKAKAMILARERKILELKEKARREAEEAERKAREEAAKEEERRRKISLAKGGDGNVEPVIPEKIVAPVEHIGMRSTTRTRSIIDNDAIQQAVDDGVRKIPGVYIYCVWKFTVEDSKLVPDGDTEINGNKYRFRKLSRA